MDTITIQAVAEMAPERAAAAYPAACAVFWETAPQAAELTGQDRELFLRKYFGYYWDNAPDLFLCASEAGTIHEMLGYICGVSDTRAHHELYQLAEHIPLFDDLYSDYPAHLHINLTSRARGQGLGARLIHDLEDRLARHQVPGLHLVTSTGKRNVSFYRGLGFTCEVSRSTEPQTQESSHDCPLFMAKRLT